MNEQYHVCKVVFSINLKGSHIFVQKKKHRDNAPHYQAYGI